MWIKRLGPGAGFVAIMMNSFLLIFAIFLRMALTIYKTFSVASLLSNLKLNSASVYHVSFQVDRIWDRVNQFDGFKFSKHLFLETHAWYFTALDFYSSQLSTVYIFVASMGFIHWGSSRQDIVSRDIETETQGPWGQIYLGELQES